MDFYSADLLGKEHLETAFLFAHMAQKIEDLGAEDKWFQRVTHTSFVRSSVISAACSLESYINEWFSEFDGLPDEEDSGDKMISTLWSMGIPRTASFPILKKYQVALTLSNKNQFNEGAEPFQSANMLIKLRNALVHYEPTFEPLTHPDYSGDKKPHELTKKLTGRFPLNPLVAEWAPLWTSKILSAGCAKWAASTAFDLVGAFYDEIDPEHFCKPDPLDFDKCEEIANSDEWQRIL